MKLVEMTRAQANMILDLWRTGKHLFTPKVIDMALYVTGDLASLR